MDEAVDRRGSRRTFLIGAGVAGASSVALTAVASPVGATAPTDWENAVVDHGANGNATGDDRPAIQGAIDAAAARGTGTHRGGVVYLPPGEYPIDGSLEMRTGVQLCGAGIASQIRLKSGHDEPAILIEDDAGGGPSAYTVVRDLSLLGATGSHTSGRHGIAVRSNNGGSQTPSTGSDSFVVLANLMVQYFGGHGLAIGVDPPLGTADVRAIRIHDVIAWECGKAAVGGSDAGFFLRCTDGIITSCMAAGCSGPGFHVVRANNQLSECKAYFNHHEFHVQGNRTQISNCSAQDGLLDGFRLEPTTGTLTNVSLTGCQADTNANAGLRLSGVSRASITGLTSFVRGGGSSTGPGIDMTSTTDCLLTGVVNGFTTAVSGTNSGGTTHLVT